MISISEQPFSMIEFKTVVFPDDLDTCTHIVRDSFITVADEFNLTPSNCPTNPAFIDPDHLLKLQADNRELYLVSYGGKPAGFVAIERSINEPGIFYIEKVCVLPEFRHLGMGTKIMGFAMERIKDREGTQASVAIIDENVQLKNWYKGLGFEVTGIKKFDHLPFTVGFMKKKLR